MPPQITQLITGADTSELVRDQIAAILAVEIAEQQVLAAAASEDPNLWKLRIFSERTNPWAEFIDAPEQSQAFPIVNVALDNLNYDGRASNTVERQKATGIYHIDCYGYGVSEDDGATGHIPGDARAALEAQRAVRLVRRILMAATYSYLGMRGTVWRRWIQSVNIFRPTLDGNVVQQIVAARIAVQVEFNEFSPQVQGEPLELVSGAVLRKETGEIYFEADYAFPPSP